ncbi:hypothetical protein MLD38_025775 [Melastoma candidum]|uniref:Uncharacterized protein n=1 Tax=Melastoma candidum TaxID=119954 RepID=A0ACB9NW50_9MYRT|nr:hypothetical protein MLD38_025775 [Melastoma candidum]
MTIFARLQLGSDTVGSNATQVWNHIRELDGDDLRRRTPADGLEREHIQTYISCLPNHTNTKRCRVVLAQVRLTSSRQLHGVLNTVSWGTLLPTGVIVARNLKALNPMDKGWFYLHFACQGAAYTIGTAGWATGRWLGGSDASNVHRTIGLILFILNTLQVLGILLRPTPDHRVRVYWNVYHHMSGYTIIVLSVVNVYMGLSLLHPLMIWKQIYTGILVHLGSIAVLLEIIIVRRNSKTRRPNLSIYGEGDETCFTD